MNKKTKIKTKLSILSAALIAGLSVNAFAGYYVMIPINTMPQIIDEAGNPADLPPLVGEPDGSGSGSGSGSGEVNPPLPPNPLDDPEAEPSQDWLTYLKDHGSSGSPMSITSLNDLYLTSKSVDINVITNNPDNLFNEPLGVKSLYEWRSNYYPNLGHLRGVTSISKIDINSVDSFDGLEYLENVNDFWSMSNPNLKDVSALRSLKSVNFMRLGWNKIEKIPNFDNKVQINYLFLNNNNISSIASLEKNVEIKKTLNIQNNPITDLSPLNNLKNIGSGFYLVLDDLDTYTTLLDKDSEICIKFSVRQADISANNLGVSPQNEFSRICK